MSKCIFLASDCPLENYSPSKEYPIEINVDTGEIFDGGADDNFFLNSFKDTQSYSDKKFGVCLEWNYTDGRKINMACRGNPTFASHFNYDIQLKQIISCFILAIFRFDAFFTPCIKRKRLLHLRETGPYSYASFLAVS